MKVLKARYMFLHNLKNDLKKHTDYRIISGVYIYDLGFIIRSNIFARHHITYKYIDLCNY